MIFHARASIYESSIFLETFARTGLPQLGKSQGKLKIFQGQGKVGEFFKKSGKIFDIVKVSEKSGNSVFWFIVHKFSSRF